MKTRIIILIALAVVAVGMTSCEKSENKTFRVTIKPVRSTEKVSYTPSRLKTNWAVSDIININGADKSVSKDGNNHFIIPAGEPNANGDYYAVYPSTSNITGSGPTYNVRAEASVGMLPMFAKTTTSGSSLTFSTPYSLLVIHVRNSISNTLDNENLTSGKITFSDAELVFATNDVDMSSGTPNITRQESGGGEFTLGDVPNGGTKTFEFPILPCNSGSGVVAVNYSGDMDGLYVKQNNSVDYHFLGGHIYHIYITIDDGDYAL